jgi:tetratricopeptide (TPR) repeat protein
MARRAAAGFWSLGRAGARTLQRDAGAPSSLKAGLILIALMFSGASQAEPVKGEASFSAGGGYARLVFKLAEFVDTEVIAAGSIVVVRFKRPVDIPVDQLTDAMPDYVGSVRRDPDGSAIRLSLTRRVTINTMTAGERVFVDLLPDTWSGHPPGLPPEVIRELSERARAAERALRQQRATAEAQQRTPVRVRASVQPTFVRFVFETPDGVGVSSVLNDQKLTLLFNAVLSFDLADAKVAAPSNIASISQKIEGESSAVEVALIGDVDVRSFRDEKNYIIDVAFQQGEKPSAFQQAEKHSALASPTPDASHAPASAVPAPAAPASASPPPAAPLSGAPAATAPGASEKPADAPPASQQSGAIASPVSESFAQQAKIEVKPVEAQTLEMSIPVPPSNETPPAAAQAPPNITLAAPEPPPQAKAADNAASVSARRDSDGLRLMFSFAAATPAALFRRADTVWLVFDSQKPLDIEPIRSQGGSIISEVSLLPLEKGQAIRIRLSRPQMPSLAGEDQAAGVNWTVTFSDTMQTPTQPLAAIRNITDPALANVIVPLSRPGLLHRLVDPDAGDALMVVTALPPVRGFIKRQDFVEMSLLESIHGVAVRPNSDDVTANIAPDKIILGKPGGLTLSSADIGAERAPAAVRPIFDVVEWRKNQAENFVARQDALVAAAAAAEPDQRTPARVDLARFYMSRGLYPEAMGVLDLALADAKPGLEDPVALTVHSVASSLMGRPEQGLKDLVNPAIGTNYDAQLWKALAYARQGKWAEAREKFKNAEFAVTSLPIELQRILISEAMRCSLEVRDYSGAAKRSDDLDVVGLPSELKGAISVLRGRLAEALGHDRDALGQYRIAIGSADRAAAAEAKLLEIVLRQKRDEISQTEVLRELETLSVMWRGDAVEVRALQIMARIYPETGRYGESFAAARTATRLQPNSEPTRQAQDAAAALFAQLFLSPKGDDLPPVDALGMFYEYRELTPIGRRGDEMIRRLADRLVAVDLLDQASELLQYQVDKRLEGAARAQVAARLAMVYLTSRKPDRAISALRTTRIDVGRHDLALDIISNINGREAIRLRSDIYWASRRWREASEQIELYYADRWRDFKPLNPLEKGDVIRAVVGYALAEDAIGLARFREKYAPLMTAEPDRAAFETASKPATANSTGFADIARMAASVDTLDGFLREMRTRFPDATARAPLPPETVKADPFPTGSLPALVGLKRVEASR